MDDRLVKYLTHYRAARADDLPALEAEIWEAYGVERAVIALDMSGFSRLTDRRGILHFLSLIQDMREITRPIVEAGGGEIVKYEADNMFAVAPSADMAFDLSAAIVTQTAAGNRERTEDARIDVSIGIDFGRLLLIPGVELFGAPVNFACKLGEDVARPGEILITGNAYALLSGGRGAGAGRDRHDVGGIPVEIRSIGP
ncbi:MAG TPA: adenylate/guanylate cyclase domain-containing protein [Alphaproteobacteria bacterium]|nr:adenylate/guanylate cyclase domain-containing protein [Alphaproteobacteria bacterium]